ncbi:MAG: LptF/LptG family permease [Alphaproteobacteria bacterium]|nr:LptF/LptG family permease [Alphaproteobacteria bacterium]MBV9062515.1 LptF/LptG family permease [Alphaproteobacteria bacterium]
MSLYVLRQTMGPILLFTVLLTLVIWLSQSLRLLDLVINRGQSAPTFAYLTLMMLPQLLVIILPIAFFGGTLYGLHRLNVESELVVMSAAGYSRAQLAVPVLAAGAIVMGLTYLCALYLMPLGQRQMRAEVMSIRGDIGAAILSEGNFNAPVRGLTIFVRELDPDGHIHAILVHDNRNLDRPTTYIAQGGVLAQTAAGPRLIMLNGTVEQSSVRGAHLSVLRFERYVFDLDQFAEQQHQQSLQTSERFLSELFWPRLTKDPGGRTHRVLLAEGHNRLSAPLYCLTFALIALAAVVRSRRGRGTYTLRLTNAALGAGLLRLLGYGAQGLAVRHPAACAMLYLIPALGAVVAVLEIRGDVLPLFGLSSPSNVPEPAQ